MTWRHLFWKVIGLLLVLRGHCEEFNVTIPIDDNIHTTAIVPDEVSYIIVTADTDITTDKGFVECEGKSCIINFMNNKSLNLMDLTFNSASRPKQNLDITVRSELDTSCKRYNVPMPFQQGSTYIFTCEPTISNVTEVTWRKFRNPMEVKNFQETGIGCDYEKISTGLSESKNQTFIISSIEEDDVAFYVPSFVIGDCNMEMPTAEIVIYFGPQITTPKPEFSFEVKFNSEKAESYSDIKCKTKSFPPAEVTWKLVSDEFPGDGENLMEVNLSADGRIMLIDDGSFDSLTKSFNSTVVWTDLQYSDDGNFTCTASNGYAKSSQWYNLRVKDPLRPLWPALGIVGVIILILIFMSSYFLVELVTKKKKMQTVRNSGADSPDYSVPGTKTYSVSSTHNDREPNEHSAVKRLSSAKPLLEESTL